VCPFIVMDPGAEHVP